MGGSRGALVRAALQRTSRQPPALAQPRTPVAPRGATAGAWRHPQRTPARAPPRRRRVGVWRRLWLRGKELLQEEDQQKHGLPDPPWYVPPRPLTLAIVLEAMAATKTRYVESWVGSPREREERRRKDAEDRRRTQRELDLARAERQRLARAFQDKTAQATDELKKDVHPLMERLMSIRLQTLTDSAKQLVEGYRDVVHRNPNSARETLMDRNEQGVRYIDEMFFGGAELLRKGAQSLKPSPAQGQDSAASAAPNAAANPAPPNAAASPAFPNAAANAASPNATSQAVPNAAANAAPQAAPNAAANAASPKPSEQRGDDAVMDAIDDAREVVRGVARRIPGVGALLNRIDQLESPEKQPNQPKTSGAEWVATTAAEMQQDIRESAKKVPVVRLVVRELEQREANAEKGEGSSAGASQSAPLPSVQSVAKHVANEVPLLRWFRGKSPWRDEDEQSPSESAQPKTAPPQRVDSAPSAKAQPPRRGGGVVRQRMGRR